MDLVKSRQDAGATGGRSFVGNRKRIGLGVHQGDAKEDGSDAGPLQGCDAFL
jgi:hypothetical protein